MEIGSSDHLSWLKRSLGGLCEELPVEGDKPLLLDDPHHGYVTLSEHHQLFCVERRDGRPAGRREHVATCPPGLLLIGVAPLERPTPATLLLSGVAGSVVWRIPVSSLLRLAATADGAEILGHFFDGWIGLLIASLPAMPVPTRSTSVLQGQTVDPGDQPFRSGAGLCWIAPRKPPISYLGIKVTDLGVTANCWPLLEGAWALCSPGELRIWSSRDLVGMDASASFAQGFVRFVLAVASRRRADLARYRLEGDERSLAAESGRLSASLGKLARVGRAERLTTAFASGDRDFARALAVVHEAVGVPPPKIDLPDVAGVSEIRAALDRATGARSRTVVLEGPWWKADGGPLLGFVVAGDAPPRPAVVRSGGEAAEQAEDKLRAVALLPARGGYNIYDPAFGERGGVRQLTKAIAAELYPQAQQFYRPLPPGPVDLLGLLRVAGTGAGPDLVRVAIVGLLVGLLGLLIPIVTGVVFDRIVPGAERSLLTQIVLALLAAYGGSCLFDVAQGFALVRVETRLNAGMEAAVWDRLLRLPLAFFRRYAAGDLAARAAGVGGIREALAGATLSSILGGITSLWNLALLFVLEPRLAAAATALVAIAAIAGVVASGYDLRRRRRLAAQDGRISGLLVQMLSGIAKLKVARAERRAFGLWADLIAKRRSTSLGVSGARLALFHAVYPIACSALLFYLIAGQTPGMSGSRAAVVRMTTGQFLAFFAAFSSLMRASLELIGAAVGVVGIIPLYERAKPILVEPPESEGRPGGRSILGGQIEISHLSFRYQRDSPLILDDVTMRIEPGEFVAVVGPSGSGKSTLLRLLLGFETPPAGGIFYDGQALSGLDLRALRQQIGVVLQRSDIMTGDIYTNIVGSTGATLDEAWAAARRAALDRDIEAMPMGMHTVLSQGASTLSGGQRQRLLIARALVSRPRILFFDEATSALDNRTQAEVSESLDALQVTRIVIAHRLSTVQHADRIAVLERGRVVEMGSFNQLLARDGRFSALARRQII
jgi:NHLM bacteriocin system ABC transporter ATP-binding protein